jgi:hypothetical protein
MDAETEELRAAHDVLAEFYADRLADALDNHPDQPLRRAYRRFASAGMVADYLGGP